MRVVIPYKGVATLNEPGVGTVHLRRWVEGRPAVQPARPCRLQGADGVCGSEPMPSVACIGYGPGDASIGVGNDSLFNTMAAGLSEVDGVYAEAP